MTEEQLIIKIKEIEKDFMNEVSIIEKKRKEKINKLKKDIDHRKIDKILKDLKNN